MHFVQVPDKWSVEAGRLTASPHLSPVAQARLPKLYPQAVSQISRLFLSMPALARGSGLYED